MSYAGSMLYYVTGWENGSGGYVSGKGKDDKGESISTNKSTKNENELLIKAVIKGFDWQ